MGVSKNRGTPKSSILIGFSIINHPFWGPAIFGNTHMKESKLFCSWKGVTWTAHTPVLHCAGLRVVHIVVEDAAWLLKASPLKG